MNNNDLNEILELLCSDSIPDKKQYDIPHEKTEETNYDLNEILEILCGDSIPDEKYYDIPCRETNNDTDMELMKLFEDILGYPIEAKPSYEEKLKVVSEMEKKYTEKFGDIISDDEEYKFMSFETQIQTIQKCLKKNKPKLIIPEEDTPSDDDENQCSFLKHMKIFY